MVRGPRVRYYFGTFDELVEVMTAELLKTDKYWNDPEAAKARATEMLSKSFEEKGLKNLGKSPSN